MTESDPARLARRYRHEDLFAFCVATLARIGIPDDDAAEVAGCLVKAELRGIDSHGLVRLPVYASRVRTGVVNGRPEMRASASGSASALLDGDNGLGPVVGARAMELAIDLAERQGTGFVGVRQSNHFGPAAYYVEKAVERGLIGVAISNAPPNMAPFGGRQRFLGTNPIGVGIPAGDEPPLVFDASTSVAARGKIIVAAHNGWAIPEGWAVDPQGYPTTDAAAALAGAVLPFGGPKGSAISFIIDILCGVLTGASFASHLNTLEDLAHVQNVGHVLVAIRTDLFLPAPAFGNRMDEILRMLKSSPPAPGIDQVLVPGELEFEHQAGAFDRGIALSPPVVAQLTAFGRDVHVDFPSPVAHGSGPETSHA